MHELFKRWEDKIFEYDLATRRKLLELLGDADEKNTDTEILQRDRLDEGISDGD